MDWLLPAPDFRGALSDALKTADPNLRLAALARLAQFRLSYLETIQLDRALSAIATQPRGFQQVRLALLGAATVDHLVPAIRVAGLRRSLTVNIHVGRFGQYRQDVLEATSPLASFGPDVVLLAPSYREAIAGVSLGASRRESEEALAGTLDELRGLWRAARTRFGCTVIQQSYLDVTLPLFGNHDRLIAGAPSRLVARLNDRLADAASDESVLYLDVARWAARDGLDQWFDTARWLHAKMQISIEGSLPYGEAVARLLGAHYGRSKKCLVLDLDNTLWGGVVGDDGVEGIVLGEGSAAGEAYVALQEYAKGLAARGIVLAVCSKNDPSIAESAFGHPEMRLKRSDIAAFVANWADKAENLRVIAERLNLGLDSFVFVDDNPVERARVREALPMVAVPELPADPAHYVRCIADAGYFEGTALTEEDQSRTDEYAANVERDALRNTAGTVADFLGGLDMVTTFGPVRPVDLPRVTQLINKTNQFNTTARRMSAEEVAAAATAPENLVLQFRLADRFGDSGLVSVMLFEPADDDRDVLSLRNWVMSCRVFGRELEIEAMNIAVETAKSRGVRAFRADYVPTAKNSVVGGLFATLGFTETAGGSADGEHWALRLAEYEPKQSRIRREARADD